MNAVKSGWQKTPESLQTGKSRNSAEAGCRVGKNKALPIHSYTQSLPGIMVGIIMPLHGFKK
ncbi:MAG: hypothetical protein GY795_29150 [Desulfobacterales bacterium]|nr:hypothetical protein [Desulfobacterales bacterium]